MVDERRPPVGEGNQVLVWRCMALLRSGRLAVVRSLRDPVLRLNNLPTEHGEIEDKWQ